MSKIGQLLKENDESLRGEKVKQYKKSIMNSPLIKCYNELKVIATRYFEDRHLFFCREI